MDVRRCSNRGLEWGVAPDINLSPQRVDDFFDHIAVASRPLVMYLLDGVLGAKLHTGTHDAPQLVRHLSISSLQAHTAG